MSGKQQTRGLLIAAPRSASGKTVVTLGLLRALMEQGVDIAGAKAGPDYIDPAFHSAATGSASVNLDPWAMKPARLLQLAHRQSAGHLLIEAMMGLFDGAADGSGTAADLAVILGIPVVLVIDAARQSQSVAALARGFRDHCGKVRVAGVILNWVASDRHEEMMRGALDRIGMPLLGAIRRDERLALPSRHLGLVQAGEHADIEEFVGLAGELVAGQVNMKALTNMFAPMAGKGDDPGLLPPLGQTIAVARDEAFSFIYPHMLADWRENGAAIRHFSPLADEAPPPDCDAIFLPGGYPELYAGRLAIAEKFKSGMRRHAEAGSMIYGECGGYMVLGTGLEDAGGMRHAMCGLLALETSFAKRRRHLGYRRLHAAYGFPLGADLVAHEYHFCTALSQTGDPLYQTTDAVGKPAGKAGLRRGNVMGSYMHVIDRADL